MEEKKKSVFETLNAINCNEHTEKKNGLTYLSWAWAWQMVKSKYPDANYTVYENADGWNYFTDGRTCWVKTGVTINGQEHIEYLPVMDYRNTSILKDKVTSFDVNKAIQRSLTKACARHGLGLYIYAGEDLPESAEEASASEQKKTSKKSAVKKEQPKNVEEEEFVTPVDNAIAELKLCQTKQEVMSVWSKYPQLQKNETFKAAAREVHNKLQ